MARIPIDKKKMAGLAGGLGGRYIRFVHRTSSRIGNLEHAQNLIRQNHPCIIAFWHGQFMLIPGFSPTDVPVAIMVAKHDDGELIGEALRLFDMELIRGSGASERKGDRGGAKALREAVRALSEGKSVPMTADVPPGPARKAGLGIVKLAQLSGRPILPVAAASSRYYSLDTWSRMTINLPFSRIGVGVGDPIHVPMDADATAMEHVRQQVETSLNALTAGVYEQLGADPLRATPDSALPPDAPPRKAGFKLNAYRLLTRAAPPVAPWLLRQRQKQGKEDASRIAERLGKAGLPRPEGNLIWVHAASVGETNAILPLLARLREARPDTHILLTTGTLTSAAIAAERLPENCFHQYVPWDIPQAMSRFLDHWRPAMLVLTESEIWPNTIIETHRRGIPIALVNARLSGRSQQRWRKNKSLARPLFGRLRLVLAQNDRLARVFRELGARDARPTGNLKIDAPPLPVETAAYESLQRQVGTRPVWIAASTHPGEDEIVIAAHARIATAVPGLVTIIAPRHPERGAAVEALAKSAGLRTARRSIEEPIAADTEIYVADTIGELGLFYRMAPVAFIGGSLVEHGGQNPIEAVRFDTAVITGPHVRNFIPSYNALLQRGGAIRVTSADTLAQAVTTLLKDEVELARMRQAADFALESLSGALDKTVDALLELLPDHDGALKRAS